MTYQRFEDLPVWIAAQDLGVDIFALVNHRCFSGQGDLRDQLQRASLSISTISLKASNAARPAN